MSKNKSTPEFTWKTQRGKNYGWRWVTNPL